MDQVLFLIKSPPYGTLRVTEGYRAALATAASGVNTRVLLLGDGVYAALAGQDGTAIDQPTVAELIESLVDLGVEVLLLGDSVTERRLPAELLLPLPTISFERFAALLDEVGCVLTF